MLPPTRSDLVIITVADVTVGMGHLMRCLALGQAWKDQGGEPLFVVLGESEPSLAKLLNPDFSFVHVKISGKDSHEYEQIEKFLLRHPKVWVVLDGYRFGPSIHERIRKLGHPLLVIDDLAELPHYCADIVLNLGPGAETVTYAAQPTTHFLLGPAYTLLRKEFGALRNAERNTPEVAHKLLVSFGGSDPKNVTGKVLEMLEKSPLTFETRVILGHANPHEQVVKKAAALGTVVLKGMDDMASHMAWAEMAICGGGTTSLELAFMRVPTLILVLEENQARNAHFLAGAGVSVNLGAAKDLEPKHFQRAVSSLTHSSENRRQMSKKGREMVDGLGATRVVTAMKELSGQAQRKGAA